MQRVIAVIHKMRGLATYRLHEAFYVSVAYPAV